MAHKTFISYKWSEAQDLRDDIIEALGDDATYYKGETSDSPDLTDTSTENIKKNLKDNGYDLDIISNDEGYFLSGDRNEIAGLLEYQGEFVLF